MKVPQGQNGAGRDPSAGTKSRRRPVNHAPGTAAVRAFSRPMRILAAGTAAVICVGLGLTSVTLSAAAAPIGQGFNVDARDLSFILKQIKIAERHAATSTAANPCGTLLGSGPDQIPGVGQGVELPWGLRSVDGSCNNLLAGQEYFGTAGKAFPLLANPVFNSAESGDPDGPGPAPSGTSTYAQSSGIVFDSQPRVISNLIVDQTANNPAAAKAAGETPTLTPSGAFLIPNVAPDVGLSAPYNSWFTLFGQFFDHGLDLTSKGGRGSVFMPLKSDDPLYDDGVDNVAGNADDGPNFMVLTRATTDGSGNFINQTSSFVDQSQTYSSHPSHQVFLRDYAMDGAGKPQATGDLITGPGGGMANWTAVKAQALTELGIALTDADALSVPLLATDAYGKFTRGANGFPQMVTVGGGLLEGNPLNPIATSDILKPELNAVPTGVAFLDDISHFADPVGDPDGQGPLPRGPLSPDTSTGTTDDKNRATYDDEMLGAHFIAGDGRVNENIGLISVHHVFHAEHNRLLNETDIDPLTNDPGDLKTVIRDYAASNPANPMFRLADWQRGDGEWDGERLFQAARFVTEMEYQHLAFEEFTRKVQPMVNLFGEGGTGYNTSINPSIRGEFANAVYRFGHSMLTESVDRVSATGARTDIPLLDAFLNPPSFMTGGQSAEQAAGDVVRGMTRQVGNEIDEFVTEAVRNELLGLPLDLPALNIARARETGTPSLNAARRLFYASTNNSALTPYESWVDFNFNLRHKSSLLNFVAAYGTHDLVTAQSTLAGKRNAAVALVYGAAGPDGVLLDIPETAGNEAADNPTGTIPTDRENFLNGIGAYANGANGVTTTGVDDIDLWMGGLAEKQAVFGGLLGSTFNHVFEQQMEDLQNGDRFYYLSRTVSLNLLTQLEGNSFSELIQRNTDVSGLPADSFSRPDFVFDVGALGTSGPILDDPATEYNEAVLLIRMPNGTIRYGGPAHAVFNGTADNNRVWSSEGDDTVRGNDGNDWMQGGDGNDSLIGGLGDDTLLDSAGDDTLKGGDGNDVLSSGQGFGGDLNQGGRGDDFIVGGNDITETFAGHGDDFVFAGDADDTVFGDEGNDWLEAGRGNFNLLQGDNGAPFQDDATGGHDVLIGYGGEQDYDAEGGDDVMLAGPGIQRNEGMLGFDWVTHKADPTAADSDMLVTGLLPPSVETNRDRFDLVETLSGWDKNDVLRGDSRNAVGMVGHELNAAGIGRVNGVADLLPNGASSFTGGNIILGGAGSDTIEGRGGDDIIDGDAYLNVRISVRDAVDSAVQLETVDTMAGVQARVLAGTIKPGQLRTVREILTPANGSAVDIAQFSDVAANYTVTTTPLGAALGSSGSTTTVVHNGAGVDGTDTLRNVERLLFSDSVVPGVPAIGLAVAGNAQATVNWTASAVGVPTGFLVRVLDAAGAPVGTDRVVVAGQTSLIVTGLTNGSSYTFQVSATNAEGTSAFSASSNAVTPSAPVVQVVAGAPTIGTPVAGNAQVTVNWTAPTPVANQATITGYRVRTYVGTSATVFRTSVVADVSTVTITALTNGTGYSFDVAAINAVGTGAASARSVVVTPTAPVVQVVAGAPVIGTPVAGNASVTVNWAAPAPVANQAPITGYRVRTFIGAGATATGTTTVGNVTSTVIASLTNRTGYSFDVAAINAVGTGAASARSVTVIPRTEFVLPTVIARTPASGARSVSQTANLTATFSEPVALVSGTTFVLRLGTTVIPAAVSYNTTTRVATLDPSATLLADRIYTVTLSGIRDTAGNTMATRTWSFTTGPAPTITTRTPASGATGVGQNANATATFSEDITGVSATTVQITRVSTGAVITSVAAFNATTNVLTINPSVTLTSNVQYRVTITGGTTSVRDLIGNPFVTRTWTFTTGSVL